MDLSLSDRFSSCSFTAVTKGVASFSPITASAEGNWSATSYFLDSSGRSSFLLPLQLACRTKDDVDHIVASKCLQPAPQNVALNEDDAEQSSPAADYSLRLEAQSHLVDESGVVTVESITILSTLVEGNSVLLDTQVTVRAPSPSASEKIASRQTKSMTKSREYHLVKTRLDVTAVLASRKLRQRPATSGLVALELGGGSQILSGSTKYMSNNHLDQSRLGPLSINVSMTHALSLVAKSAGGCSLGSTLVSLTIKHPNTHGESVTITNIALHPGHSRQDALFVKDRSMPGGERSVVDMSKSVKWGYVPDTAPPLPLTLQPHEAFSTILAITAMDDVQSRAFASPIAVTAVVGPFDTVRRPQVVVATDAQWTTGRVAVEPSDAFRVELNLRETSCCVGAPFVVSLRVQNLCAKTRDLMLLMPKADEKGSAPAVSELHGYTFGVWGISSGDDAAASENNAYQELLAMDAAVLLGEVRGQQKISAEIRFVPLRDGPLQVPDFKLYDKLEGKWYNCAHKLCVVAEAEECCKSTSTARS